MKSPFSNGPDGCVEFAVADGGGTLVRNSRDPHGPRLHFNDLEIDAFLAGAKAGAFDRFASTT